MNTLERMSIIIEGLLHAPFVVGTGALLTIGLGFMIRKGL